MLRWALFNQNLSMQSFKPPVAILGLIMMLGPCAIDLYLPLIPNIAADLQADARQVSFALSIYMLGFALGHLVWGGLSDSLGRLRILFPGLISYILLNILAAMSQHISQLMIIRGLQGLAGAAVVTVIPALVYDCFTPKKCARVFSLILFQLMALMPLVVITVGLVIVPVLGWRGVFGLLACMGVIMLILVRYHFVETLAPGERLSLTMKAVIKRYTNVLSHFSTVGYLLIHSLFVAGALSFLVMSPMIYAYQYNVPVEYYGILYAVSVSFGAVCCFVNSRLVGYFPLESLVKVGLCCGVITTSALLFMLFSGLVSLVGVVICTTLYYGSFALVGSNANTLAFSKLPFSIGTVNSVGGVMRFSIGGLLTGLCAWFSENPLFSLACTMLFCSVAASVVLLTMNWLTCNRQAEVVLPYVAANDEEEALPEAAA